MANGLPNWDCGTEVCTTPKYDGLVLCHEECPMSSFGTRDVAVGTVIKYGAPLKAGATPNSALPLLATDPVTDLTSFSYCSVDRTVGNALQCKDICVVERRAKLRGSVVSYPVGYTAAQKTALIAQAKTALQINIHKLA